MKNLHRALMGVMLIAVVAVAVGFMQPAASTALAQHGQHGQHDADGEDAAVDLHEHFAAVVEYLELTDAQRETLGQPLTDTFMAIQELHRLHGVITAELTDEQLTKLQNVVHGMFGGQSAEHGEHQAEHGEHDADGERHREERHPGDRH